ncbi:glycosyltransferase family 9 protein [Orbus wheelerorum]|uniref:glycosyltransferase family 9 protein n=1 Tax=Orbus wheelerorum TaxID=3074111 RepID=UPI00370D6A30
MKKLHKKIKLYLRQFRLFLGRLILDKKPSRKWDQKNLSNCKILFIRHDGKIGDFILSSFVYREIKKQCPNIHIGVVAASETEALFRSDPYIDSIYVVPKRALVPFWQVGRQVAKENYDVIFDLTEALRNRDIVLIRSANSAINIGYNQRHLKLFNFNVAVNNEHITLDYEKALIMLGLKNINRYFSFPNIPVRNELRDFCQKHLSNSYIAINFFGAAKHRQFSSKRQQEWLAKLKEAYPDKTILVLTYPKVTQELKSSLPKDQYLMYENTQTIFDTIELIRNAYKVITPDTSIVHIASAFNKPIIAFYMAANSPIPYNKWMPMNADNASIYYYQNNINEIQLETIKLN